LFTAIRPNSYTKEDFFILIGAIPICFHLNILRVISVKTQLILIFFFFLYSWTRASQHESVEITNKMQPCHRIYYSRIYWRFNRFRAAHRSSSGAPNCICSLKFPHSLDNGRSPHGYINQRLQIQFGAPDDERYAAGNMMSLQ